MTSLPTPTTATDKIVDVVASQAVEIAKDVALPAAKFAAIHFLRTRAKTIVALVVVASAVTLLVKRQNSTSSPDTSDRPSSNSGEEFTNAEERA